jgi:protein-arginine kinase activator protein McsA
MSEDIDHEYTKEIVCPHCGYEYGDSWEYGDGEDIGELECDNCYKPFYAERIITIDYSTQKLDE